MRPPWRSGRSWWCRSPSYRSIPRRWLIWTIEYRKLADESGAPCYLRVPTVGADEAFIAGLADLVRVQHRRGTACETRGVCEAGDGGRICPAAFWACLRAMTTGADPITWPGAGALGQVRS